MRSGALLALAALALALRGAALGAGAGEDPYEDLFLDARAYAAAAQALRAGHGAGDAPYLLSPLYPLWLALFPPAHAFLAARAVQALFGALTCALAARVGSRLGGRAVGVVAGLACALFGPLVDADATLLPGSLQTFALSAALLALVEGDERPERATALAFAAGLALGTAAALRASALVLAGAAALLLAREARRAGAGARGPALRRLAALACGTALVVAPFTLRNRLVAGEWVLLSANGGLNAWIGNHTGAPGVFAPPPGYDFAVDPVARGTVERALGREPSYGEASAWWWARTAGEVRAAPASWLALLGRKVALFHHPGEIPQLGAGFAERRDELWPLRTPLDGRWIWLLAWSAPLALAAAGGRAALRRARWPLLLAAGHALTVILFFVSGRHRLPGTPAAAVLAAAGLGALALCLRRNPRRALAPLAFAGALLVASAVAFRAHGPFALPETTGAAERQRGMALAEEGRDEDAVGAFHASLALRDAASTRVNLARALERLGRGEEAERELRRAVSVEPRSAAAWLALGVRLGDAPGATADATRLREAEAALREALRLQPELHEARFDLGIVLLRLDRSAPAAEALEAALSGAPADAPWRADAERALAAARERAHPSGEAAPPR